MYISPLSPSHLEADQERIREGTLYQSMETEWHCDADK